MITATGLGSGLDIDGIVAGLVAAEDGPARDRLLRNEAALTNEVSAFSELQGLADSLKTAADNLNSDATFESRRVDSSEWTSVVPTVEVSGATPVGRYEVSVTSLASSQTLVSGSSFSSASSEISTGTLTITLGTATYPSDSASSYSGFAAKAGASAVSIVVDSTNNTLAGLRDSINASSAGISASLLKDGEAYRLMLSSNASGTANSISLTVTNDQDGNDSDASGLSLFAFDVTSNQMTQTKRAGDASFTLNGVSLSSPTNKISGLIGGLDVELKAQTSSATIDVSYDNTAAINNVESFVGAYNNIVERVNALTAFDANTGVAGQLQGDSLSRQFLSNVREKVFAEVAGISGSFTLLTEVGVSSLSDGTLKLDQSSLVSALDSNRFDVKEFFKGDSSSISSLDGLSGVVSSLLDAYSGTSGLITDKLSSLNSQVDDIIDSRLRLDERLVQLETRYYRQFNAMDALVARLNNTGDFLLAQLESMPAANRDKK